MLRFQRTVSVKANPDFYRVLHTERLVRSFAVEFAHEIVEAGRLLQAVHAGRAGLFLQDEVHALMAAVLLRIPWLGALDIDAEPPPDGELRQVEQCIRAGEGNAGDRDGPSGTGAAGREFKRRSDFAAGLGFTPPRSRGRRLPPIDCPWL